MIITSGSLPTHGTCPLYQYQFEFRKIAIRFSWGGYHNDVWFRQPGYCNSYTRIFLGFSVKRYPGNTSYLSFRKASIAFVFRPFYSIGRRVWPLKEVKK